MVDYTQKYCRKSHVWKLRKDGKLMGISKIAYAGIRKLKADTSLAAIKRAQRSKTRRK